MAAGENVRDRAKQLFIRGMKSLGNAATNVANNTKFKVDEMTLQNKRRELSVDLSNSVYEQWLKGEKFSPELTKILEELQRLDDKLNDMRAEKYAQTPPAPISPSDKSSADEDHVPAPETEFSDKNKPDAQELSVRKEPVASPSLQSEIDLCFDEAPAVDRMAEKVNSSLNDLTDRIRSFSAEPSAADDQQMPEEEE